VILPAFSGVGYSIAAGVGLQMTQLTIKPAKNDNAISFSFSFSIFVPSYFIQSRKKI
jgi:hypothetical protein